MINTVHQKFLRATILILVVVIIGFIWSIQRHPLNSNKVEHTNRQLLPYGAQSTLQLRDLCHCYMVTGGMGVDRLIKTSTGEVIDHPLFAGLNVASGYGDVTVSPLGDHVVASYRDGTEVVMADIPLSEPRTIYTAPKGQLIAGFNWAVDGSALVIGLEKQKDLLPTEGTWPTTLLQYDLASKKISQLFQLSDIPNNHGIAFHPIAVDHNADNLVIAVTINDHESNNYFWKRSTKQFITFNGLNDGSPAMSTFVNGSTYFLLTTVDTINIFNMTTGLIQPEILPKWLAGPFNGISPDHRHVIYLQHETGQATGSLTSLDILTGEATVLTPAVIDVNHAPSSAVWTPDGKYLIYADITQSPVKFFAVQLGQGQRAPRPLSVPQMTEGDWIYQLIGHS